MAESLDVLIVGAGQAGLAMAHRLRGLGLRFQAVDADAAVGDSWRSRWDSLVLFTSARYSGLPGMAFPGDREAYPTKDQVADYLQAYAAAFDLPVRLGFRVTSLSPTNGGYLARSQAGEIVARRVVIATGPFQVPAAPRVATGLDPGVAQVHSAAYRTPEQLPRGRVVVVGGGNSGFQIAEELAASRPVELAIGTRAPMVPQRLLGRDIFWWFERLGLYRASLDSRLGRRIHARPDPVIGSGRHRLRRRGVTFRPRLTAARGRRLTFADGTSADVDAVVWATGFRTDHSWVRVPGVLDERGGIVHRRGITPAPGVYALGLSWLHTRGSALLGWVGDDAAYLAERIAEDLTAPTI